MCCGSGRAPPSLRLVVGHLLSEHVRRHPERPRDQLPAGARHVSVHPLARGHGLRLLLCLVCTAAARSSPSGGAVVPQEPQRPRLLAHPRDDTHVGGAARAPTTHVCSHFWHCCVADAVAAGALAPNAVPRVFTLRCHSELCCCAHCSYWPPRAVVLGVHCVYRRANRHSCGGCTRGFSNAWQ